MKRLFLDGKNSYKREITGSHHIQNAAQDTYVT